MKVFGKFQKKKKKERKLNHSSWTCLLALLQRWRRPTPRVHISTTSLITRSCWQCHVLPASMSKTASRSGARVPPPLLDLLRSKSQLHAWKRLQDPGTQVFFFFPNLGLLRALRWKRPLVVCWTLRSHGELVPPKILEKKEEVPRWNPQCRTHWAKQVGALSAWFYSLAWIFLSSPEGFLRGSDRDPARQTETCQPDEPCVNLALRSWNKVEVSTKHCVYGVRVLCLFLLLFVFLFFLFSFFFFHFYIFRNGQGQNPPSPKRACPYFGKCGNLRTVPSPWANSKKTSLNGCSFLSPGRKVCLLILKEEGLKMMNPFVGRKKTCRMLSKRNFFPPRFGRPLSSADTRPGARTGIQAGADIDRACSVVMRGGVCNFFQLQFL